MSCWWPPKSPSGPPHKRFRPTVSRSETGRSTTSPTALPGPKVSGPGPPPTHQGTVPGGYMFPPHMPMYVGQNVGLANNMSMLMRSAPTQGTHPALADGAALRYPSISALELDGHGAPNRADAALPGFPFFSTDRGPGDASSEDGSPRCFHQSRCHSRRVPQAPTLAAASENNNNNNSTIANNNTTTPTRRRR